MSIRTASNRGSRRAIRRTGFLYVAVLFTSLIVMVCVATALSISTAGTKSKNRHADRARAMRLAESEMHRLAAMMRSDADWRTRLANDTFSQWRDSTLPQGSTAGRVRHRFVDDDGDLQTGATDSVDVTVDARVGDAEFAITATLQWDPVALELLSYGVTASQDLEFESGGVLSCERPVQVSRNCIQAGQALLVAPRLECDGTVPMTLRGDLAADSVTMPTQDVIELYQATGTEFSIATIPHQGSNLVIRDRLISPTLNPFGAADGAGVYCLDAVGSRVVISHCRIDATLVIENAAEVEIGGGVIWKYPATADAILVTDAPVHWLDIEAVLDENARGVNFNPNSNPYRGTVANTTSSDVFPTEFRGLVYSTSDVRISPMVGDGNLPITGLLIGRSLTIGGQVSLFALDEILETPPPAFCQTAPLRWVRGSWRRIESPE